MSESERGDIHSDGGPPGEHEAFLDWGERVLGIPGPALEARWRCAEACRRDGAFALSDGRAREAFLRTPREAFVRPGDEGAAYAMRALPVGEGQTISAPYMVARMTDWLDPKPEEKVLEIGTGSGYQAAVLAHLCRRVYTLEVIPALARAAETRLAGLALGDPVYRHVRCRRGDGYEGWAEEAPFDAVIVTCAIDHVPRPLADQVRTGGRMILPLGPARIQRLTGLVRTAADEWTAEDVYGDGTMVVFVPFVRE